MEVSASRDLSRDAQTDLAAALDLPQVTLSVNTRRPLISDGFPFWGYPFLDPNYKVRG